MKSLKDKRDEERKIKGIKRKRKTLKEENRQKKANSIESVRGRSCVKSEKKGIFVILQPEKRTYTIVPENIKSGFHLYRSLDSLY